MKPLSKKNWIGTVVLMCVGAIFVIQALADPKYGVQKSPENSSDLWLSHSLGDEVVVTFVAAPLDMGRTVRAKLMDAEAPGIVLQLGKEEIFFSFANIISVQPARK